jgi:lactate dehydrogenase-like 2-hydroxyacid dehydrogenase
MRRRVERISISSTGHRCSTVSGKVLGIVGFGGIGRRVAAMAKTAFGMEVLVASRSAGSDELSRFGYCSASLDELLARSDVVSLHLPLMAQSKHLIGFA